MPAEPLAVIRHLATLTEPVDMRDLSAALGCHNYPEQLRNVVATLVRNRQVIRHHREDGILRYSLAKAAASAQPSHAPAPTPAAQATAAPVAARPDHSAKSKEKQLLDHVPDVPISAPDLAARSGFPMSTVANLLQRLKLKGLVRKHGGYRTATWSRVAQDAAEASRIAQETQPTVQDKPAATDALRQVLTRNAEAAEAALDAYLQSVTNQAIYQQLKQSAHAARDALAALDGRAIA